MSILMMKKIFLISKKNNASNIFATENNKVKNSEDISNKTDTQVVNSSNNLKRLNSYDNLILDSSFLLSLMMKL
ncbi:MAG: hypothetical protein L6V95_01400 [Candidatus Melainabacteria bacterium]|nr:MAG: hypothetical protein L6V95_01400 [Candidatus Melainabacteria bacterium]